MYRLATIHSVTVKRTDIRHHHANSRSLCVQYDRQKTKTAEKAAETVIYTRVCMSVCF